MPTHIYPTLSYRDAKAAIEFLERAFGFELVARHEDGDGRIQHAQMKWGESMIMLSEETADSIKRFGERSGQGWAYVTVTDADVHCERARQAGAEISMVLTDQDYGSRDYQAVDPEGNHWNFGTYDPLSD